MGTWVEKTTKEKSALNMRPDQIFSGAAGVLGIYTEPLDCEG